MSHDGMCVCGMCVCACACVCAPEQAVAHVAGLQAVRLGVFHDEYNEAEGPMIYNESGCPSGCSSDVPVSL